MWEKNENKQIGAGFGPFFPQNMDTSAHLVTLSVVPPYCLFVCLFGWKLLFYLNEQKRQEAFCTKIFVNCGVAWTIFLNQLMMLISKRQRVYIGRQIKHHENEVQCDQIWRKFSLSCNVKKLGSFWKGSFNIWQNFELTLATFICNRANVYCCKCPKMKKN